MIKVRIKYLISSIVMILMLCLGLFYFFSQKRHIKIYINFDTIKVQFKTFGRTIELNKGKNTLYFEKVEDIVEPLSKKSSYTSVSVDSIFSIFGSNDQQLVMKNNNEYEVYFIKKDSLSSENIILMKTKPIILLGQDKFN